MDVESIPTHGLIAPTHDDSLPYLTPIFYWTLASYGRELKHRHNLVYRSIGGFMALLDLLTVPATVYWDCRYVQPTKQPRRSSALWFLRITIPNPSLGCRFINRIQELNAMRQSSGDGGDGGDGRADSRNAQALSYTQVLLSLSRNTLAYILISFLANAALVLAYCKVIPGVALVGGESWTTHACCCYKPRCLAHRSNPPS